MNKIRLCVFDLDGTLLNTLEDLANSVNFALQKNGMQAYSIDKYRYFVGNGMKKLMERATGISSSDPAFHRIFADFTCHYTAHSMDTTYVYEEISSVLGELKKRKISLAVLSNKSGEFIDRLLKTYFAEISFEKTLGKTNRFPLKPHPASLLYIIDSLNCSKKDTVYIGDSNTDVLTARQAGVFCIGAEWGFRGREELETAGANYIASYPLQILDCLDELNRA